MLKALVDSGLVSTEDAAIQPLGTLTCNSELVHFGVGVWKGFRVCQHVCMFSQQNSLARRSGIITGVINSIINGCLV